MAKTQQLKFFLISTFSFMLGCMLSLSLVPIDKTCKTEDNNKEINIKNSAELKSPELIVFIISAPENLSKRNTIRETWLKLKSRVVDETYANFKYYFVVGVLDSLDDYNHVINSEQLKFGDILILPLRDSYASLTEKVLRSFEWLQGQYESGLDFKYILKCDDDSFVRIDNLVHEIMQIEQHYLKSTVKPPNNIYLSVYRQISGFVDAANSDLSLYWGYFKGDSKIKRSGKWKERNWILCDHYLPYALGGGYVLSRRLVTYLAQNSKYLMQYRSEDVSVGVWLSGVVNIVRIHDRRFDTEWTPRGCQNDYLITHGVSEGQMKQYYQKIIKTNNMCDNLISRRRDFLYNWTAMPSKCCNNNI